MRTYGDKKVLRLTLSVKPFKVMITGEKTEEFRNQSAWIRARLLNYDKTPRDYDLVEFVNGYGSDKPYFVCEFKGMYRNERVRHEKFSNGMICTVNVGDYVIRLGKIIEKGNLK